MSTWPRAWEIASGFSPMTIPSGRVSCRLRCRGFGEAIAPKAELDLLVRRRTTCRWRGHLFEVGIIVGDLADITYLGVDFDEAGGLPGLTRPDKYEVMGKVPVSELTNIEGSVEIRLSEYEIFKALQSRARRGGGISVPYARRWEVGGNEPYGSLWDYPYDGTRVLANGLVGLGRPLFAGRKQLIVTGSSNNLWVATNRSMRGAGSPDAYLIGVEGEPNARYAGNAAEVVVQMLRDGLSPLGRRPVLSDEIQLGFPGLSDSSTTYVGSWQWNLHGEARDKNTSWHAAAGTLAAIEARRSSD